MAKYRLEAKPFLNGYAATNGDTQLSEVVGKALVSISIPQGGEETLAEKTKTGFGINVPKIGKSSVTNDGKMRLIGLQSDQLFALFEHPGNRPVDVIAAKLGDVGYYTDQSDGWAMLRLSGSLASDAMARICPLDLHNDAFAIGDAARTAMEHLNTLILREGEDSFLLLSASSSAGSFLHAVETSLKNVA